MWVNKADGEYINLASARKVVVTDYSVSALFNNGKDDRIEVLATAEGVAPCHAEIVRAMAHGAEMVDLASVMERIPQKVDLSFKLNSKGEVFNS